MLTKCIIHNYTSLTPSEFSTLAQQLPLHERWPLEHEPYGRDSHVQARYAHKQCQQLYSFVVDKEWLLERPPDNDEQRIQVRDRASAVLEDEIEEEVDLASDCEFNTVQDICRMTEQREEEEDAACESGAAGLGRGGLAGAASISASSRRATEPETERECRGEPFRDARGGVRV